ncbi:MAG: alpha-L-glutamate ligase-like protein [Cyanobacteria bacterium J06627_28]
MLSALKNLWVSPLRQQGILGINGRNIEYIFPGNPRELFPQVDDKLKTKEIAHELSVPVPETYGVIRYQNQVKELSEMIEGKDSFVLKPSSGSGGDGIVVITGVKPDDDYRKASGKSLSLEDLHYHVHNILSGMFSLSGNSDVAFVEETVEFDPVFDEIAYLGVPDLRIIVYRGVPVMAMLRLPSKASDGKANLHKGGLGVGIDIATGTTLGGIQYNRYVKAHPDTDGTLCDRTIPHWPKILNIAAKLGAHTGFAYLGIDIVLDKERGPLLLEMNARPGLSIQIANRAGLLPRLELIDDKLSTLEDVEEKIAFAKSYFTSLPDF